MLSTSYHLKDPQMTQAEIILVIHALLASAPSGGGSPQYTLARALMDQHNITPDMAEVISFQEIARSELSL